MSIGIHLTYNRVVTLNLKASGLKQQLMRLLTAVGSNKIQENLIGSDLSLRKSSSPYSEDNTSFKS